MLALLALLLAQQPVQGKHFVDWSGPERKTNGEVAIEKAEVHPQQRCLVFLAPKQSALTLRFAAPEAPTAGAIEFEHLSAGAAGAKHGGTTRVSVLVNGAHAVRELEVGQHGFCVDRITVSKLLRAGENTVEVRFEGGETTYWLRRLEVHATYPPGTDLAGRVERIDGKGAYAVVVSRSTYADAAWREVVEALRKKHDATVIVHPADVAGAREELAKARPRWACFVARPEEAGRAFVVAVHRLTRALDADPYGDVIWGIVTGYEARDALRIAEHREPLAVRRAGAGCGVDLAAFEEGGRWYSEGEKNAMWERAKGGATEKKACPDDTTKALVDLLNDGKPDYFLTSGHATFRDWQIGYSYKNGQFRCADGQLFGLDLGGARHDIRSANPKVYCAGGNCLMGLIEDRQTMALAWMRTGGAMQMLGYVVSTWFGYGGWGANELFVLQQGRFTFAESFFLNSQALVHQLESRFPRNARVNLDEWHIETDPQLPDRLARKHGIKERDELGLLWDRDTVAFYGDPAWEARVAKAREPAWKQSLVEKDGRWTFEVETLADGAWSRPPMALLPRRLKDPAVVEGEAVVTDNFVLVPRSGKFAKGEKVRVVFTGK